MQKEKEYFVEILQKIERKGIKYVLLRGKDFFDSNSSGGELDILIESRKLKKLKREFNQIPNSHIYKNKIDLTHPFLARVKRGNFILDFDFQKKGVGYCGSPILKEKFLFENSRKEDKFFVLNEEGKFLMLFVHGFIFKSKFEYFRKYEKQFLELYKRVDKKKIFTEIEERFGKRNTKKIKSSIERGRLDLLYSLRNKLIRKHLQKNLLEIFPVFISKTMRFRNYFHLERFFYFINPFKWAPLISFIGSDGSGKSSFVRKTEEYMESFRISNKKISAGVFSKVKNPFEKKKDTSYSERVISSSRKKGNLKLLARVLLQIPLQMKILLLRKRGILVITDRYTYDLINFYNARGMFKILTKLISQRPSKCFYVKVKPEILIKRNKDLKLSAIKKVVSNIEKNKEDLSFIELKNENFKESEEFLLNNLSEVIKNV